MFSHLLVPLDGSRLAEAVLPAAEALAHRLGAQVTLLHVVERRAPAHIHGDRHLGDPRNARAYLEDVMARLEKAGVQVESHVHEVAQGDVAASIVRHSEELANDLILLSTHGHGGVRDLLVGSIAQQVLVHGTRPVLVVHPDGAVPWPSCRRVVVPLDARPLHEHSLPVACGIAAAFGAQVHLVTVVPRRAHLSGAEGAAGRMLPLAAEERLRIEEEEAVRYLERVAARLCRSAASVATAQVRRGEPAQELLTAFQEREADLVVMASHALKGWDAFWAGSVTPRILSQWHRPILLVRAT